MQGYYSYGLFDVKLRHERETAFLIDDGFRYYKKRVRITYVFFSCLLSSVSQLRDDIVLFDVQFCYERKSVLTIDEVLMCYKKESIVLTIFFMFSSWVSQL